MISTWSLQNFKSVYKEPSLRMAPLTIFAGANSSGKSTVIQSILLTAQTLQSAVVARPIVLNGHIVRLGAYDDIVSDGEKNSHIQIGFSLSPDSDNYVSLLQASSRSNYYRLSPSNTRYIRSLTCKFAFSAAGGDEDQKSLQLQPRIENCSVEITAQRQVRIPTTSGVQATLQDQSFDIEVVRSNKNYEDRLRDLGLDMTVEEDALTEALAYEVPKCTRLPFIRRSVGATPSQKPSGALLNHFLPGRLCVSYDSVGEQIKRMVEFIVSSPVFRSVDFDADDQWLFNDKVKTLFIGAVQELLHTIRPKLSLTRCKRVDKAVASVTQTFSPETVRHFTASLLDDHKRLFSHIMAEKSADIQKILKSERPPLHTVAYVPLPELGEMGVSYIQAFFTQRVKYLGPLRDEPKPVYPLAGASDSRDGYGLE